MNQPRSPCGPSGAASWPFGWTSCWNGVMHTGSGSGSTSSGTSMTRSRRSTSRRRELFGDAVLEHEPERDDDGSADGLLAGDPARDGGGCGAEHLGGPSLGEPEPRQGEDQLTGGHRFGPAYLTQRPSASS